MREEIHFPGYNLAFPDSNSMYWGFQAKEELQKYLNAKESVSNTILQTDQALTAKERQRQGEQDFEALCAVQEV